MLNSLGIPPYDLTRKNDEGVSFIDIIKDKLVAIFPDWEDNVKNIELVTKEEIDLLLKGIDPSPNLRKAKVGETEKILLNRFVNSSDFNWRDHVKNRVLPVAMFAYWKDTELMAIRGLYISHQTVHNWVQTFGVEIGMKLRTRRKGQSGNKWHTDATYVKIAGNWCYLYRAIDREGNLVDVYLSDTRDQVAAENFFKQAQVTTNITPIQITTDKEPALYAAIENIFPDKRIFIDGLTKKYSLSFSDSRKNS